MKKHGYLQRHGIGFFIAGYFALLCFFVPSSFVYAFDTYQPNETITIGEFIYNDDYTPTADDCTISIYNPNLVVQVADTTMTDEGATAVTGWHYYTYLTPSTEGKYPAYITCGSAQAGNLFKLDKSFVVKAPVVTDASLAAAVDANTSADISAAVTDINTHADTNTGTLSSTLTSLPASVWGYTSRTLSSFGSFASDVASAVWSSPSRSLTSFGSLVADIWGNTSRTVTGGTVATSNGISASDVWSYGTRNLTDGTLTSGSLALVSSLSGLATTTNVTDATSPLATTAQLSAAVSPLATAATLALIKTKTDMIDWTDVTSIKNNASTIVSEIGTGNITAIKTKTDTVAWSDITGIVTDIGLVKAKTDTIAWSDVAGIKTKTDTIAWGDVTGIKTATDTILWTDIAALAKAADVTSAVAPLAKTTDVTESTNILSAAIGALNNLSAADVWSYSARTLTSFGTLVSDIWAAATRTLTGISPQSPWMVTVSDFGTISAGGNYLATVTTVYNGTLTDALSVPTVTIYDPNRNTIVSSVAMTRASQGTYTYAYTTAGNAPAGVWETTFSAQVEPGKTLAGNDYWNISTSPAQVIINSVGSTTTPNITANITITNEGLSGYEYQYEWCVVSSPSNNCGGGDDIYHAVAAKYINPQEDFNTTLTATVPNAGSYYFKLVAYFDTDSSTASRSFTAVAASNPPSGGNSGGGAGGAGGPGIVTATPTPPGTCEQSDFNCDKKINSIDFSVLLYYWKSSPPFKNSSVDINKDGKVDSVDFSILLYRWGRIY
ncbi:MAG: hypothetical protein HGA67_00250 [Candidatus Yonathbacteria bacterium]|nr:hypothetical protein [Candidatus Yonathbacteria bacterium]